MKINVEIDLSKKPEDIDVLHYMILTICALDKETVEIFLNEVNTSEEDISILSEILDKLQTLMYIKIIKSDDYTTVELRKKATNLFPENKGASFDEFWEKYHEIAKKPKTDKEAAFKHWKRLKSSEQQLALDNIENYITFVARTQGDRFIKKARTYLADKNFNDEFGTNENEDWTKNHV